MHFVNRMKDFAFIFNVFTVFLYYFLFIITKNHFRY